MSRMENVNRCAARSVWRELLAPLPGDWLMSPPTQTCYPIMWQNELKIKSRAQIASKQMVGFIAFHLGEESGFKAKRAGKP